MNVWFLPLCVRSLCTKLFHLTLAYVVPTRLTLIVAAVIYLSMENIFYLQGWCASFQVFIFRRIQPSFGALEDFGPDDLTTCIQVVVSSSCCLRLLAFRPFTCSCGLRLLAFRRLSDPTIVLWESLTITLFFFLWLEHLLISELVVEVAKSGWFHLPLPDHGSVHYSGHGEYHGMEIEKDISLHMDIKLKAVLPMLKAFLQTASGKVFLLYAPTPQWLFEQTK